MRVFDLSSLIANWYDLRVLDLADPIGVYCAKQLADLGADVMEIEPPGRVPPDPLGPAIVWCFTRGVLSH